MKIKILILALLILSACSNSPLKEVSKLYTKSINNRNPESLIALYDTTALVDVRKDYFKVHIGDLEDIKIKVVSIEPPYINISYKLPYDQNAIVKTTVYTLPNGKIRYDPFFFIHPAIYTKLAINTLSNDDFYRRRSAYSYLKKLNIPTFSYSPEKDIEERNISVSHIRKNFEKNMEDYDFGEIEVPFSPADKKLYKDYTKDILKDIFY